MTRRELAQHRLDQWDLTERWVKHTARMFGNILDAPEPEGIGQVVDESFHASGVSESIAEYLNSSSVLRQFLK